MRMIKNKLTSAAHIPAFSTVQNLMGALIDGTSEDLIDRLFDELADEFLDHPEAKERIEAIKEADDRGDYAKATEMLHAFRTEHYEWIGQ